MSRKFHPKYCTTKTEPKLITTQLLIWTKFLSITIQQSTPHLGISMYSAGFFWYNPSISVASDSASWWNEPPESFSSKKSALRFASRDFLVRKLEIRWRLMVSAHLKNMTMRQNDSLPQIVVKIKPIWNHHPVKILSFKNSQSWIHVWGNLLVSQLWNEWGWVKSLL